jgi:hypothetical protein
MLGKIKQTGLNNHSIADSGCLEKIFVNKLTPVCNKEYGVKLHKSQ